MQLCCAMQKGILDKLKYRQTIQATNAETTWCAKETVTPKIIATTFRTFLQDITSIQF